MPVWEVAQCRIEDQAPVVTWEITSETHRLRCFSFNHCGPGIIVGRQNNSVGIRQKVVDVRYTKFQNGSARNYLRRPSFWTTVL